MKNIYISLVVFGTIIGILLSKALDTNYKVTENHAILTNVYDILNDANVSYED